MATTTTVTSSQEERKSQQELIRIAFNNLNAYKRHRTLARIEKRNNDYAKANFHQVKANENFEELELALRAIQYGERNSDNE